MLVAAALLTCVGVRAVHAAPCCGGGVSFPALMVGDDERTVGLTYALGQIIGDAPVNGLPVFRGGGDRELTQTVTVSAAKLLSDRWQAGVSVPLLVRSRHTPQVSRSRGGLGDVAGTVAFEALPEWTYSPWKPRAFAFAQLTAPTGGSVYDVSENDPWGLDSRGRGFWQLSVGSVALKSVARIYDLSLRGNVARSFARQFSSQEISGGWEITAGLAAGASPDWAAGWRVALSLTPVWESAREGSSNGVRARGAEKLVWNAGFDVSRLFARRWLVAINYGDQTLVGPAHNVSLSRTVGASLQYRWER